MGSRQCFSCSGLKAHFLLASRYGEETTACLEVLKIGILEITQVFFFHGQITLLPVSNDIALLLGAQGKMKSIFQPELRGLLVEDSLKKLSSFPPKMTFQGFGYPKMPIKTGGRAILGFQGVIHGKKHHKIF